MDASLVIAHSDKQLATGTYKGTFGHHPLEAWCDNTGESLALKLRKGSAGSNTAVDHIEVLTEAIAQIPARYRRDLLITVDGAGASHGLVEHISTRNDRPGYRVHYSIGWSWALGNVRPSPGSRPEPGAPCWTPKASRVTSARPGSWSSLPCCGRVQAVTSSRAGRPTCGWSVAGKSLTLARSSRCSRR